MQYLTRRIALMEQFVRARQLATVDVGQMFQICRELLSQPKVDESVRVGDIYGCMVESYYANRDMERCVALLVEMRGAVPAGNVEFCKRGRDGVWIIRVSLAIRSTNIADLDEKLVQVIRQSARGNIGVTPLATTRRGADVEVPPLPFGEDEIVEDIRGHHD